MYKLTERINEKTSFLLAIYLFMRRTVMDETEQRNIDLIEEPRQELLDFARDIEGHPEHGFQEVRPENKKAELLTNYG